MDNVFEPSFGNRPDRIVGRDDVLADIDKALRRKPGSRDRAMLIIGQRGMGKTALLLEVETRAKLAGYVTGRTSANENMLDSLIERLQVNGRPFVDNEKRSIRGASVGAFGFSFGLTFSDEVRDNYGFQTKLSMLCDRLAECNKGVLLLVDEVTASSPEMRILADSYQQLVGDGKNIAICMAGLPSAISSVLNDKVLTFLNRASKIRLGSLPFPSIREYYSATFESAGFRFASDALDKAVTSTRGFPYLLQLIGYYLVEETRGFETELGTDAVDRALSDSYDDMRENVFRPALAPLSKQDNACLRALARVADDNDVGEVSDLVSELGKENGYVQVYRRRLLDAGVVISPGEGRLQFVLPLMAEYLRGDL